MKLILLALLLLGCSRETPSPLVVERSYDSEADRYWIRLSNVERPFWREVTAEEFRVIDVGDSWLAPE